jgi:hypothetical protein
VAEYSQYLGATVTVQYRLGDILLSATGVFVGDSGRSIFLEQHLEQRGRRNYFRWEIPYPNIHTIEQRSDAEVETPGQNVQAAEESRVRAAAAGAGPSRSSAPPILPLSQPPKTA